MDFREIQRTLVRALLRLPLVETFNGRSSLLHGLPNVPLQRSENLPQLDLNNILSGLHGLGRLPANGGARPVIVVVNNALDYVPEGSELAFELHEVRSLLEEYYGGDLQPALDLPDSKATFEALVFGPQRDARVGFAFVREAHVIARSVARLTVSRAFGGVPDGEAVYGTGWIIAPGVLITNHHVIEARDLRPQPIGRGEERAVESDFRIQAETATVQFDYYSETGGSILECKNLQLRAFDRDLDYAILELNQPESIADRRPIAVVRSQPTLKRGARVNIVQHPRGGPLRFAIRNNFFVRLADRPGFMLYQTDTEPGASGSPVCDDDWQVVALHHASLEVPSEFVPQEVLDGKPTNVTLLNEAVSIHDVINHLPSNLKQRLGGLR